VVLACPECKYPITLVNFQAEMMIQCDGQLNIWLEYQAHVVVVPNTEGMVVQSNITESFLIITSSVRFQRNVRGTWHATKEQGKRDTKRSHESTKKTRSMCGIYKCPPVASSRSELLNESSTADTDVLWSFCFLLQMEWYSCCNWNRLRTQVPIPWSGPLQGNFWSQ
jgi:hypothetical protein